MATHQAWAGVHRDLLAAKSCVYDPVGFDCARLEPEPESAEYAAHAFTLDGRSVRFRVGKTTPTKVGQFVTLWQRSEDGPIRPFDVDDGVDLVVVSSRDSGRFGQFVFPAPVLCERGIVSGARSAGKRGFRVYPPWVATTGRQARTTQSWQVGWFLDIDEEGRVDPARATAHYRPGSSESPPR
ncbi:MepB family protein [Streptomyces sp. NPDC019507]|uniref:MepB family protein n=1 Tax=Streptomyces sp. NPDC019507 TaxID=3154689 RepID=UPI0033D74DEA